MIIADTSVWIDYFNGKDSIYTDRLDVELDRAEVAVGDIILLEILQGFRNDSEYRKAKKELNTLDQYEMFGHAMVYKCADNYRTLRKSGITIRKTVDIIIATFCIENKFPLLFSDKDFAPFVKDLGLVSIISET